MPRITDIYCVRAVVELSSGGPKMFSSVKLRMPIFTFSLSFMNLSVWLLVMSSLQVCIVVAWLYLLLLWPILSNRSNLYRSGDFQSYSRPVMLSVGAHFQIIIYNCRSEWVTSLHLLNGSRFPCWAFNLVIHARIIFFRIWSGAFI